MPSLRSEKYKAWIIYSSWRVSPSRCPALEADVHFTLKGWNHLIRPGGMKKRLPGDLYRRLKALPMAKEIIEKSHTVQNITKRGDQTYYVLEAVMSVIDKGLKVNKKIRVILYQDKKGNYKFLSVMPKNVK